MSSRRKKTFVLVPIEIEWFTPVDSSVEPYVSSIIVHIANNSVYCEHV